ncbi:lipopolysaccharide assembly protein LapB [Spirosoma sp. KNUC1025]|uniref:tetratricopeptide repeat protein n=1 Tax=Spirosoma sp. KNUC1025 TaxID=2894082 RepID=UPI0038689075|nr:tetratricopeptide repeat protein [Spirosoma sp. KNUC1025]
MALWLQKASLTSPDFVFPNRLEECVLLKWAIGQNPADAHANYFLGNFWYANRQYDEAISCWERSASLNDTFPTVFRNLALAYFNKRGDALKSLEALEKAYSLDTTDARVLMELDQLYKKLNHPPTERLSFLENHRTVSEQRDDLYLERITLYNQLGDYETARTLLKNRQFHPWEGGEGRVVEQYLISQLELAKQALIDERFAEALALLTEAETYPTSLGEGKLFGVQENDIFYLKGLAYEGMNDLPTARTWFERATVGLDQPEQAIYYNDQQPDKLFYQGLAWKKLNELQKAEQLFNRLIEFGENHFHDVVKLDYFAVSLPDLLVFEADLNEKNRIHCQYLMGLGHLGLGNGHTARAIQYFDQILVLDANHQGAARHKKMVDFLAGQTV